MFTGIIKKLGKIKRIKKSGNGMSLTIAIKNFDESLAQGASIAINGICLTVINYSKDVLTVDAVKDTLERTNLPSLRVNNIVNTELPLKLNSRLDGHILEGHIDGVGKIISINRAGTQREVKVRVPGNLVKYIVENGSIGIDGISLTVKAIKNDTVSFTLIPLSFKETNFKTRRVGDKVNIEVDRIAKYVEKYLQKNISN